MKWEELENNQELLDQIAAEVDRKVQGGQNLLDAKIEALKAFNIEFDEDEMRASAVDKMELDPESLQNVTGGRLDPWCMINYSCYNGLRHDDNESRNHACWSNYYCLWASKCSKTDLNTDDLRINPWHKS